MCVVDSSFNFKRSTWNPRLRHNVFDWEFEELFRFFSMLENHKPDRGQRDTWVWGINEKGFFTTKSFYLEMMNSRSNHFPHKGIWVPSIPSKVSFFLCIIYMDKILTLNHLQSKG